MGKCENPEVKMCSFKNCQFPEGHTLSHLVPVNLDGSEIEDKPDEENDCYCDPDENCQKGCPCKECHRKPVQKEETKEEKSYLLGTVFGKKLFVEEGLSDKQIDWINKKLFPEYFEEGKKPRCIDCDCYDCGDGCTCDCHEIL